jgi:hypothetical protein
MPVKTIIINGDTDWDFRSLLMSHGLDLYKVESGVFCRDCTPVSDADGGVASLLANFPENFAQDPFALEAEVREDLRAVFRQDDQALSMAVVLSRKDVEIFAKAGDKWDKDPRLSDPAKGVLGAMKAATELVEQQEDREHRVSRANTRVWFALVVRDAGASFRDAALAETALAKLSGAKGHIHNAFLLSNGMDQDGRKAEQVEHFIKLRGLIDILSTEPAAQIRSQLRKTQRQALGDGMAVAHVRLPQDGPHAPEFSTVLRTGLMTEVLTLESFRGQIKESGAAEDFKRFVSDIKQKVPSAWSDPEALEVTSRGLDGSVKAARVDAINRDDLQTSDRAKADASDIINKLTRKRFTKKLFMFRRNPSFYTNLQAEYEAAFDNSREAYGSVVGEMITLNRKEAAKNRPDLVRRVENFVLPPAGTGEAAVAEFKAEIGEVRKKTKAAIDAARAQTWRLEKGEDGGAGERAKAFQVAQMAEDNLAGPSALVLILLIGFVSLVPVGVFYGVDYLNGRSPFSGWAEFFKAMGVLLYVALGSLALAVVVAIFVARSLRKKRELALEHLANRLKTNFDTLRGLAASRLALTLNRTRLTDLELVWQSLASDNMAASNRDVTLYFNSLLSQAGNEFPAPALDEARFESLLTAAKQAFKAGKSDPEKIRNFLARRETPDAATMTVTLSGIEDRSTNIPTIAHLSDTRIILAEPGHD